MTGSRERKILEVLAAAGGRLYGLDLVAAGARWSALYVVLSRMEDRGLIEGREEPAEPPRLPRRSYAITDVGRAELLPTARIR